MITPAITLTAIFSIIGTLQLLAEPQVFKSFTSAVTSTFTPNLLIYSTASVPNVNLAAAFSVVLALFFGFFAVAVALVVLLSVLRWIRHKYENPGGGAAAASSINAAPLVAAKDSASQV